MFGKPLLCTCRTVHKTRRNLDLLEVTSETCNQRGELVVRGVWTAIIRG